MEFTTILMEGGEWSSFNGASVNEEADFMAKMFPESSLSNEQEQSSCLSLSSSFYSSNESNIGMVGDDNVSFYSTDTKSNIYSLSEGSSLSARSDSVNYQSNEIYYVSDPEQTLAVNGSSVPVGFWLDTKGCIQDFPGNTIEQNRRLSLEMSCDSIDESETKHEMPQIELAEGDKSSDSSELKRKTIRKSQVEKGKRNVRTRRSRKACLDDEENSPALDKEKSGECSYEDDLNGGNSNAQSADNLNLKTRASRGSAVDPQSLYARKRRERINERLRILQRLVPNGTKVDISTMLEEAVHYVKFLELQIKLLSSDELWMYAPLAYNGMDIGLDSKLNSLLSRA